MNSDEFYQKLGKNIALTRKGAGLTQAEMVEKISLSRAALASIESGRQGIHVHQLLEIANALGVPSAETLLPANLLVPEDQKFSKSVATTGSVLTKAQQNQIASIVELLG